MDCHVIRILAGPKTGFSLENSTDWEGTSPEASNHPPSPSSITSITPRPGGAQIPVLRCPFPPSRASSSLLSLAACLFIYLFDFFLWGSFLSSDAPPLGIGGRRGIRRQEGAECGCQGRRRPPRTGHGLVSGRRRRRRGDWRRWSYRQTGTALRCSAAAVEDQWKCMLALSLSNSCPFALYFPSEVAALVI